MNSLPPTFLTPQQSDRPYTVSEINNGIARIIDSGNTLLWVEGEISNLKRASSGHCYFTLKDANSQISCVMWRSTSMQLKFDAEDGIEIMAIASIRVYQKAGRYQLEIHRMQPSGLGALFAAFEKLKKKLDKEGLFDKSHKKALPETVSRVGVITSRNGAAVRDIIKVIRARAPQTDIVIRDVSVQGAKAAKEIGEAIEDMNRWNQVDCIIIGRGGGSLEDLWAFNEEIVARTIFASDIPIISAVGHEIDFTIADFVADLRAPTPSAAGEMAVPDTLENRRYYKNLTQRFAWRFSGFLNESRNSYTRLSRRSALRVPLRMITDSRQTMDDLRYRQAHALSLAFRHLRNRFSTAGAQLQALSPLAVLGRGYSVVTKEDGTTVKDASQISQGEDVRLRFKESEARAKIR
ncbi:MAG: exodeoxyribonuclease VII large subunit [Chitinivibrionales bacterium]|nr:exodeoxyribonuclease VII large subunit [Chitinivibrionales bacterium]